MVFDTHLRGPVPGMEEAQEEQRRRLKISQNLNEWNNPRLNRNKDGNLDFDSFVLATYSPDALSVADITKRVHHKNPDMGKAFLLQAQKKYAEYISDEQTKEIGAAEARKKRELEEERKEEVKSDPAFYNTPEGQALLNENYSSDSINSILATIAPSINLREFKDEFSEDFKGQLASLAGLQEAQVTGRPHIAGVAVEDIVKANGADGDYISQAIAESNKEFQYKETPETKEVVGALEKQLETATDLNEAIQIQNNEQLKQETKEANERQLRNEAEAEAIKEVRASMADINNKIENFEIDPMGAFPTAWSMIGAALAAGVGAYAQGLSSKQIGNSALDIIQRAIDRDIAAQKHKYTQMRGQVQDKNNIIADIMREGATIDRAESEAYGIIYKQIANRIEQYMGTAKTETQRIAAQATIGQVKEEGIEKQRAAFEQAKNKRVDTLLRAANLTARASATEGPGKEKELLKARKLISTTGQMIDEMDFVDKAGTMYEWTARLATALNSPKALIYRNQVNIATQAITKYFQGGRPSNYDVAAMLAMFPTGMPLFSKEGSKAVLEALDKALAGAGAEGLAEDTLYEIAHRLGGQDMRDRMDSVIAEGWDGENLNETADRIRAEGNLFQNSTQPPASTQDPLMSGAQ